MGFEETLRSIAFPIARFAGYSANAFLFGAVPLLLIVLRPAFAPLVGEQWEAGRRRVAERLEGFVQAALIGSALATLVILLLQTTLVTELTREDIGSSSLLSVLDTSFGRWHALRFPLLAALAVALVGRVRTWALAQPGGGARTPSRFWWGAWAAFALGLIATSSFSGHASVASPRGLSLANDVLHLATAASWFAGICVLAVVLPDSWKGMDPDDRLAVLAPAVTRFSRFAFVAIALVALTGTLNSFFHIGEPSDLVDTGYGRALFSKIGLFLVILAMGGINHFFLRRRFERPEGGTSALEAQSLFRKTIAVELAVALAVMGMTGFLVGQARTKDVEVPSGAEVTSTLKPSPSE